MTASHDQRHLILREELMSQRGEKGGAQKLKYYSKTSNIVPTVSDPDCLA